MLDKNFESHFKFLHVLPGAWSGYRYEAIKKSTKFKENLIQKKYLKQILNPDIKESTI
jgi:chitin synthase